MTRAVGLDRESIAELRAQFRTEQIASWIAGGGVLFLAVVFTEPWGLLLGVCIAVMALVRLPAFTAIDRDDVVGALWWSAAGTWGIALIVAAVLPGATPIMILNLIGPLVTGAIYLDARSMRRLIGAGVVVAVGLGALGFRSSSTGAENALPAWLFQLIMIVYLAVHVMVMSGSVSVANRVRIATLEAVVDANDALRSADADLRESRRRVISAGDRERVRLERNIHDGAQQRLVALAVQLQLASQFARNGTPITPEQLDAMHTESREAIAELRELARGIYPSVLTERGLEDALRSVARRSPNPVEVVYDDQVDLPTDDAAAIYFICLEALQNIAKHAGPDASARLTLEARDGDLHVSIVDDGLGCNPAEIGRSRGVVNMIDRASALGADLTFESEPGRGTSVCMVLPDRPIATVDAT